LRLIRTADWTTTTLNPLFKSFIVAGDLLLGMNGEPGRDVAWPYAYVREISPRRTLVVDLRNGRTVGETGSRRPPVLLVP
jgi:hypothetical protein